MIRNFPLAHLATKRPSSDITIFTEEVSSNESSSKYYYLIKFKLKRLNLECEDSSSRCQMSLPLMSLSSIVLKINVDSMGMPSAELDT